MKKKILELEKKLSSLKGEVDIKTNLENKNSNPAIGVGIKISVDFVSTIVVGVLIGLGIDKLLDTKPIFFIIFFILGLAAAFLNMYRTVINLEKRTKR